MFFPEKRLSLGGGPEALPLAHGLNLPGAAVGVCSLDAFGGYVRMGVMKEQGLIFRYALLPGNARGSRGRERLTSLPTVLGDRGFR